MGHRVIPERLLGSPGHTKDSYSTTVNRVSAVEVLFLAARRYRLAVDLGYLFTHRRL